MTTQQSIEEQGEDRAWQCAMESEVRPDGARIEGHPYQAALKVIDYDTEREYEILHCTRCGNYSAAFHGAITHDNDSAFFQVIKVGGEGGADSHE